MEEGAPIRRIDLGGTWYVPLVLTLLCLGVAWASTFDRTGLLPHGLFKDFNAFYCAGAAVNAGANPYLNEPLATCEHASKPLGLFSTPRDLAYPAPLPGYALGLFALVAHLPYGLASLLWLALLMTAYWVAARATYALTGGSVPAIAAVYALGYAGVCLGQLAPIALAGVAVAAYAARNERPLLATAAIVAASLEPHVAVPAALSLFAFVPRMRLPLALALGGLACLSVAVLGVAHDLLYFQTVLPAHAVSEMTNDKQFSLTYVLWRLGVSPETSRRLGEASYAVMLVLGIVQAARLAKARHDAAYLAAIPPLFIVIGGPFVHAAQMIVALPAAFLLHAQSTRHRAPLGLAIIAFAVPWVQFSNVGLAFAPFVALAIVAAAGALVTRSPLGIAATAVGAVLFTGALYALPTPPPGDATASFVKHWNPVALAETSWTVYMAMYGSFDEAAYTLAKVPTWLGLFAAIAAAFAVKPPAFRTSKS